MHRGYTKRWRKRWDKGYHRDPELWVMMDYFIDFANHKDTEVFLPHYGNVKVKRGEHIFGVPSMSRFLGISQKKIRKRLKILEKVHFGAIKRANRFSIFSVINYDLYNPLKEPEGEQKGTDREQAGNKQGTKRATPNKLKNYKELKKTYLWLDLKLWKSFREHRIKLRAAMTPEAEKRNILKLKNLMSDGSTQDEIIGQSIERGWKGLFPVKKDSENQEDITAWRK